MAEAKEVAAPSRVKERFFYYSLMRGKAEACARVDEISVLVFDDFGEWGLLALHVCYCRVTYEFE